MEEPGLTLEHITPESLGGKVVTLSCKSCNSTHGSRLDSHLVQMVRSQDSLAGLGNQLLKGRIGIGGHQLSIHLNIRDRIFSVRGCKPAVFGKIDDMFEEDRVEDIDVNLRLDYIPGRAYLALLQISRSEHPAVDLGNLIAELKHISPTPREPLELLSLRDIGAIVVVITLFANSNRYYAVPMPMLNSRTSEDNVLKTLHNALRLLLTSGAKRLVLA